MSEREADRLRPSMNEGSQRIPLVTIESLPWLNPPITTTSPSRSVMLVSDLRVFLVGELFTPVLVFWKSEISTVTSVSITSSFTVGCTSKITPASWYVTDCTGAALEFGYDTESITGTDWPTLSRPCLPDATRMFGDVTT